MSFNPEIPKDFEQKILKKEKTFTKDQVKYASRIWTMLPKGDRNIQTVVERLKVVRDQEKEFRQKYKGKNVDQAHKLWRALSDSSKYRQGKFRTETIDLIAKRMLIEEEYSQGREEGVKVYKDETELREGIKEHIWGEKKESGHSQPVKEEKKEQRDTGAQNAAVRGSKETTRPSRAPGETSEKEKKKSQKRQFRRVVVPGSDKPKATTSSSSADEKKEKEAVENLEEIRSQSPAPVQKTLPGVKSAASEKPPLTMKKFLQEMEDLYKKGNEENYRDTIALLEAPLRKDESKLSRGERWTEESKKAWRKAKEQNTISGEWQVYLEDCLKRELLSITSWRKK